MSDEEEIIIIFALVLSSRHKRVSPVVFVLKHARRGACGVLTHGVLLHALNRAVRAVMGTARFATRVVRRD